MTLTNLKHYKDIIWLLYKYGNVDLRNFNSQIDIQQLILEHGDQKAKAEDLATDLESLGPFYIKLGQILSSESELIPPDYDEALQRLQDKAIPMPFEDVESVIFEELGDLPSNIYKKFEKEPISAASLGQVHIATLNNGRRVAVKVQRKDIQKNILEQLDALENIANFLENNTEYGKRYHITEKMEYLKSTLLQELDYLKEANNLKILSENLKNFEKLLIPLPIDEFTTNRVLTMDFIKAEKITELTPIEKLHMNGPELARELFRAFLKQILIDGFFQMDPHPGNIYMTHINKKSYLALFDLGMVSHVPFQLQGKIITCLLAMSEGKELEVSNTLISAGKKLPEFDEYKFRSKITEIVGNFHRLTINQLPIGKVILQISYVAAEAGLWLPIQFSMIGKTLLSLYSVLRALDPELNPSKLLKEEAFDLVNRHLSQQLSYQTLYTSFLQGIEFLEHLPNRLNQLFDFFLQNNYELKIKLHENEPLAKNFQKIANRITLGIILASLVISSGLMMQVQTPFRILGYPGFAMIFLTLATIGSLLLIFTIILSDREKK